MLFALRVLPLVASVVITFVFVVPSFQLLEPRSMNIDEGIGAMPLALGVCALFADCLRLLPRDRRPDQDLSRGGALAGRRASSECECRRGQTVTFRSRREAPPLTLVGVQKPRVLVSESTVALLSHDELHIALKHEIAHMQSRDNLKKLLFHFCPFPGMATLESAWSQAAEMAADDAAVSNLDDAVDLAAALVKLSRLVPVEAAPICTVGFVTGSISARVARLLAWNEARQSSTHANSPVVRGFLPSWWLLWCVFATYGPALR